MKNILYLLALLFLPIYGFPVETDNYPSLQEKIRQTLDDKTTKDPYTRWLNADNIAYDVYLTLPFDEAMFIFNDIMLPFIDKKIKKDKHRNMAKAYTYSRIKNIYMDRGEPEDYVAAEEFIKKAIKSAELSENSGVKADLYQGYSELQSKIGNIKTAHRYYYKAIRLYESIKEYDRASGCLFNIAESLRQIHDFAGLYKITNQMQYYLEIESCPNSLYDFYIVRSGYYSILSEKYPENTAYKDSVLMLNRKVVRIIEDNLEEFVSDPSTIASAYYSMSLAYKKCYPEQYDSICYFLDKALEVKQRRKHIEYSIKSNVYSTYAQLHFEQKRYEQAEKDMLYVLSLLEQMKGQNSAIESYSEAYKFFVMFHETMNRPAEALKYHRLLLENEAKRYDNDKIVAMNDMLIKYEVEKKKEQIDRLSEQNETAKKILILTIIIITVLLIGILILIRLHRLRKKNLEQSVYESALLAELKQNELEQNLKERERLLEQKPTKTMIGKLNELILESVIEKAKKNAYIQQLSELDIDMLEQGYITATEKISNMDMKYIICFAIDMDTKDMSILFNVELASINTVRYRIKKKFREKNTFKFLM